MEIKLIIGFVALAILLIRIEMNSELFVDKLVYICSHSERKGLLHYEYNQYPLKIVKIDRPFENALNVNFLGIEVFRYGKFEKFVSASQKRFIKKEVNQVYANLKNQEKIRLNNRTNELRVRINSRYEEKENKR